MKVHFIQSGRGYLKYKQELDNVFHRVCSSGDFILRGDLEAFEKNMAQFLGTKYFVGVNSGTDAIYIALKAAGVGAEDEVITVAHTFQGTIEPIVRCGAKPVLVDINEEYLMDVSQVGQAITPKTRAIIPVHLSGDVCEMNELQRLVDLYQRKGQHIALIEDVAQAFGARYNGSKVGSIGYAGCFSFYFAKILGCFGDGGGISTNDEIIYREARLLRNHYNIKQTGLQTEAQPEKLKWSGNSRLDNLQAAILNLKFKYIDDILGRRQQIAEHYDEAFQQFPISLPTKRAGRVYQEYVIRCEHRDELKQHLEQCGVSALGADVKPLHQLNGYDLDHYSLPLTEKYTYQFLRLPCNDCLTEEELAYVIKSVQLFYNKK
jgi:dTDP-4-amino-4,6-dideoxygalactose transaminase